MLLLCYISATASFSFFLSFFFSSFKVHPQPQQGPVQSKVIDVETKHRRRREKFLSSFLNSSASKSSDRAALKTNSKITLSAAH